MRFFVELTLFLVVLSSCDQPERDNSGATDGDPRKSEWATWRAWYPLDTATLIATLNLKESFEWSLDTTLSWEMDTVEVVSTMPACTCPDHQIMDTAKFGDISVYIDPFT